MSISFASYSSISSETTLPVFLVESNNKEYALLPLAYFILKEQNLLEKVCENASSFLFPSSFLSNTFLSKKDPDPATFLFEKEWVLRFDVSNDLDNIHQIALFFEHVCTHSSIEEGIKNGKNAISHSVHPELLERLEVFVLPF